MNEMRKKLRDPKKNARAHQRQLARHAANVERTKNRIRTTWRKRLAAGLDLSPQDRELANRWHLQPA